METYDLLTSLDGLIREDIHPLSNLANAAALVYASLDRLNWAGFYFLHEGVLWLGPFQGKIACTRIDINRGVCGAAFSRAEVMVVPDVHAFPGHIACDEASRSEIVLPLFHEGRPCGVLDLDSPIKARFGDNEKALLTKVAELLSARCDFSKVGFDLK